MRTRTHRKHRLALAGGAALALFATSLQAAFSAAATPAFRGQPNTEFAAWESFTVATGPSNLPDDPGTTTDDAELTQELGGAAITSTGSIYSPAGAARFVLSDRAPGDLQEVSLQTSTEGSELVYANVRLEYVDPQGALQTLAPHTTTELARFQTTGIHVETWFEWDLSAVADPVFDYELRFEATAAHLSLDALILDTRSQPSTIQTYCTAKPNSLGCVPAIQFQGTPSIGSGQAFTVSASGVLNNKPAVLFYGYGPNSLPFQGGFLCVQPPVRRTAVQSSAGNPPPNDCSGILSFDFNAWVAGGADPNLIPGTQVFAQYWSRDPQSPSTTNLTDALEFLLEP